MDQDKIDIVGRVSRMNVPRDLFLNSIENGRGFQSDSGFDDRADSRFAEKHVVGVHGVGETVRIDQNRFPRLKRRPCGTKRVGFDKADPQQSRFGSEQARSRNAEDDRRRVADSGIVERHRFLIQEQAETGAKITFGEELLDGLIETRQGVRRGFGDGGQRAEHGANHSRKESRVDAVAGDVGDENGEAAVVSAHEVVNVAAETVGGPVAHGDAGSGVARSGRLGHDGGLNLARQVEFKIHARVGRFEQAIAGGQFATQIGDPQLGSNAGEKLANVVGSLRLFDVVVGAGVQAGQSTFDRSQGGEHHDRSAAQILVGIRLERPTKRGSVHLGHLIVRKDQFGLDQTRGLQALSAVLGGFDLVAFLPQKAADHAAHDSAVVHHQDAPSGHGRKLPASSRIVWDRESQPNTPFERRQRDRRRFAGVGRPPNRGGAGGSPGQTVDRRGGGG